MNFSNSSSIQPTNKSITSRILGFFFTYSTKNHLNNHEEFTNQILTMFRWLSPILLSIIILIGIPLSFYSVPPSHLSEAFLDIIVGWNSLLHTSIYPLITITSVMAFVVAHKYDSHLLYPKYFYSKSNTNSALSCILLPWRNVLALSLFFTVWTIVNTQLQIIRPSWLWNPFMWNGYRVYKPFELRGAMEGICFDSPTLCLSEESWRILSSDALSSRNSEDVAAVHKGLQYSKHSSGGLVVNVLSRDTVDSIPLLRENIEALVPMFSKLSVVIFENDSKDGTRVAFEKWSKVAIGYSVDLMSCPEHPDCQLGESHRYDSLESKDYFRSSAIGRMAEYRQRILNHILENYKEYSHMLVVDLDLGISISPFGILHSFGTISPANPVASAGRQVWPGSSGTLIPPYDFSAFRPFPSKKYERISKLHDLFCALEPPGDRWRNQCDAVSSMHFMLVLGHDFSHLEPYRVISAFNGATLYPLDLIQSSGASYDAGEDMQRCEHIGFNLSLKKPLYVNPKWDMHVDPANPGGPTGIRAAKNVFRIVFTPSIAIPVFCQNFSTMILFVYAVMIFVMYFVYPVWVKIITGATCRLCERRERNIENSLLSLNDKIV